MKIQILKRIENRIVSYSTNLPDHLQIIIASPIPLPIDNGTLYYLFSDVTVEKLTMLYYVRCTTTIQYDTQ